MKTLLSLSLSLMLTSVTHITAVEIPSIFSDNMVLQQNSEVAFWGKARPGENITIRPSWNGKSYSVRASTDGKWKTRIPTPRAGGPFAVTIKGDNTITLNNVLIGEVWICSGQSNMEMTMSGYMNQPVKGALEHIATSSNDRIRLITVPRVMKPIPSDDIDGAEWLTCNPESVSRFSATAYFFGMMINRVLDVPVGLISVNWSGSRIEPWMSREALSAFDWVTLPSEEMDPANIPFQTPVVMYNAMINPVAGFGIRGAIWYQGESNRLEPERYMKLFPAMVADWRKAWGTGDFPFYFVQIAPFDYGNSSQNSAFMREVQMKLAEAVPNTGMACVMDTGEKDNIHPADKKAAGDRLAYQALAKTYSIKGIQCDGPVLKEMKVEGNIVKLTFNNAPNGLTSYGKTLSCFEVAGPNKRFYPATAVITWAGITLFSPSVSEPVAVRYAFRDFITGDLFNTEGLPASSFRTDNWDSGLPF